MPAGMKPIQVYMMQKPYGFVTAADMPEVIRLDAAVSMLVRCGMRRYLVPAVMVEATLAAVRASGDYVRDVSFAASEMDDAREAHKAATGVIARIVREVTAGVRVNGLQADGATLDLTGMQGNGNGKGGAL